MLKRSVILTHFILLFLIFGKTNTLLAQMKIGDNVKSMQASSILELESTKKGLLLTRLSDTVLINALNPPNGMIIYYNNSNHQAMMVRRYNRWVDVITSDSLSNYIQTLSKNLTSSSPVITIQNGAGATLQSVVVNLNAAALGHLFTTSPLNDSLAIALTKGSTKDTLLNIINRNSINSINASNGLSKASGNNIILGGTLSQATTIATSATNTLALTGLQDGNLTSDSVVVAAANTGILKKVAASSFSTDVEKVTYVANAGQSDFVTPSSITKMAKINVYRNGINVEFSQVDTNHIRLILEDADKCFSGDEIKIIQSL